MLQLAVTSALLAQASAQTPPLFGSGQLQGYVHSIDETPTVPHYAHARWADFSIEKHTVTLNPTGRVVPVNLGAGSIDNTELTLNVQGTNLNDHIQAGTQVTVNPARFETRVCVHHGSRNPFGLYSVSPELPCTCESPIIGTWAGAATPGQVVCPVTAGNPNGVCTYLAGADIPVVSTAADPTSGTISLTSGDVDGLLSKQANIADPRVPENTPAGGQIIVGGYELDVILCGFTEPRRHLYDLYHPNDGLASVRVPYTEDGSVSGTATNAQGVGDVLSTYLLKMRRSCNTNQDCVDRAADADPVNGVGRNNNLDRLRATVATECHAALGVCVVPQVEKRCGRNLYDFRDSKCCSSDETQGKIVYPRGTASFRSVNDASDWALHDQADLGEMLLDVGDVEEFPCPCTGDDGIDDVKDFAGSTYDLGAQIGCERTGQKCCTFRQLLDVYQSQSPNYVGADGTVAATRRAIEINPDLGIHYIAGGTAESAIRPVADDEGLNNPFRDTPDTATGPFAAGTGGDPVPDGTGVIPNVNGGTEGSLWESGNVGQERAALRPGTGFTYPQGSTVFPYYFCYDAAVQQCCDDGQVYNPQTHQCCPIGNVVPVEQPCVCSSDAHCVRPELETSDPAYARRTCCMQTSPPTEAMEEHVAMCNRYASVNMRFDESMRTDASLDVRDTNARFTTGIGSFATWRYSQRVGSTERVQTFQTASEYRYDINAPDGYLQDFGLSCGEGGCDNKPFEYNYVSDSPVPTRGSVINGYDRTVSVCPGTCIDPTYQLCCNGATCRGEYERCCNKTCCNKFGASCVKGKRPADEGLNGPFSLRSGLNRDDRFTDDSIWSPASDSTVASLFSLFTNQVSAGDNQFWSNRNYKLEYDVCTAVEHLDPVRAFWVFILPTFLLLTSVVGLFATVTFLLRIRTGYQPRYTCGETTLVSLAFLEILFALFLFFSPQWKYGVVVVLSALFVMFVVGINSQYAYSVMVVIQLVVVGYLVDPFGGNRFFNLNEQRTAGYMGGAVNGLTWYASGEFNPNTNGLWRAINANYPSDNHRSAANLFGEAPSQRTVDYHAQTFNGANFATPRAGPGQVTSYCSTYYNYFQLDARLLDFKIDNPEEAFFGYCSRDWNIVLLVMAGFVILFALALLVFTIVGAVQALLADADSALASDPEHFVDAQKIDATVQPSFAPQELAE